jgi:predicted O-linked N-acetylglucosamine transferase (SPINDLY family)
MGVPVISLKGTRRASRFGASILRAAGCLDWIAISEQDFIEKAKKTALSSDLEAVRAGLRDKVLSSALADTDGLAKTMKETVLSRVTNGVPGR